CTCTEIVRNAEFVTCWDSSPGALTAGELPHVQSRPLVPYPTASRRPTSSPSSGSKVRREPRPVDPQHRLGRGEARPPAPQAGSPRFATRSARGTANRMTPTGYTEGPPSGQGHGR